MAHNHSKSRTAWEVLGVASTADLAHIRAAYRNLALRAHPDKGGTQAAWQALVDAYEAALAERSDTRDNHQTFRCAEGDEAAAHAWAAALKGELYDAPKEEASRILRDGGVPQHVLQRLEEILAGSQALAVCRRNRGGASVACRKVSSKIKGVVSVLRMGHLHYQVRATWTWRKENTSTRVEICGEPTLDLAHATHVLGAVVEAKVHATASGSDLCSAMQAFRVRAPLTFCWRIQAHNKMRQLYGCQHIATSLTHRWTYLDALRRGATENGCTDLQRHFREEIRERRRFHSANPSFLLARVKDAIDNIAAAQGLCKRKLCDCSVPQALELVVLGKKRRRFDDIDLDHARLERRKLPPLAIADGHAAVGRRTAARRPSPTLAIADGCVTSGQEVPARSHLPVFSDIESSDQSREKPPLRMKEFGKALLRTVGLVLLVGSFLPEPNAL